ESLKRAAEEELEQESSKRQKTRESSKPREKENDELTQEDLQQMVMILLVEKVYVEAIQVSELLKHLGWIDAMQEELNQFYRNKVWTLVSLHYGKIAIGSKWVFRNKKDEHGTTVKIKARLVAQGLPSTLDEGTHKSQPLPKSTATHPKDSRGNKQHLEKDITSKTPDEGTAKTMSRPEGSLRDKDSRGNIPPVDMEPIHTLVADPSGTGSKYQVDETQSTRLRYRSQTKNEGKTSPEGENATNTATEEPLSHTESETGDITMEIPISSIHPTEVQSTHARPITLIISHLESSQATPRIDKGKWIPTESEKDPLKKLVHASTIIRPDLDEPVRVEFMINGKIVYLAEQEIQEYWDKEEKMKKAIEETKLLAMSRPKVIKAFQRWDDIHKVGIDALVSYLVMASMVKTKENARFSLKLRKLIDDHPDQEKLISKKVKLETLGYHVE
nr:putative polyprotein [Tanacetum cinerariifolium]